MKIKLYKLVFGRDTEISTLDITCTVTATGFCFVHGVVSGRRDEV